MNPPEQLQLDFSQPDAPERDASGPAVGDRSVVVDIARHRQAREARRMQAVYQAIFDSIRHIDVHRHRAIDARRPS